MFAVGRLEDRLCLCQKRVHTLQSGLEVVSGLEEEPRCVSMLTLR